MNTTFILINDPQGEIATETRNYDIVLIGAMEESFLKNFLKGIFPEKLVRRTSKTIAATRRWVKPTEALKKTALNNGINVVLMRF